MEISDWIPSITTSSLLLFIVWLSRKLIITRLTNSVKHEYDKKLEALKVELKEKTAQIEAIRSGALSGVINRQSYIYTRQIEAIDQIWGSVVDMGSAKSIASEISLYNYKETALQMDKQPQLKQVFEMMNKNFDVKCLSTSVANKARPFITDLVWAYYSAYIVILSYYHVKAVLLEKGLGKEELINENKVHEVLIRAFPDDASDIVDYGFGDFHQFLDKLENLLLSEIKNIMLGVKANEDSINQALQIIKAVEDLEAEVTSHST